MWEVRVFLAGKSRVVARYERELDAYAEANSWMAYGFPGRVVWAG